MSREVITELISEQDIKKRVREMAREIEEYYGLNGQGGNRDIVFVGLLRGASIFMADLVRCIGGSVYLDYMDVSSYGNEKISSGTVQIKKDLSDPVAGRHVLIVEDIVDTGRTLAHIIAHLKIKEPKSVRVCALLDKPSRRVKTDINPDFCGFTIPDQFVLGYGLDYEQRYRNLPYIGVMSFVED